MNDDDIRKNKISVAVIVRYEIASLSIILLITKKFTFSQAYSRYTCMQMLSAITYIKKRNFIKF